MNSSILVEGKEYISASRAAKKIGYATDYIGQLCRGEKITGKLIGRTWYVDLDSLEHYKKHRKIGKRKKTESLSTTKSESNKFATPTKVSTPEQPEVTPISAEPLSYYESENTPFLPTLSKENKVVYESKLAPRRRLFVGTLVLVLLLVGVNVYNLDKSEVISLDSVRGDVLKISMSVENSAFVSEAFDWIKNLLIQPLNKDKSLLTDKRGISSQGLVVTPDTNDAAISRIRDSFSDGVNVTFDKENDSGVITPVFSENGDVDSYAFVLVPIESKEENIKKMP